jgi:ABC-type Mn2+/Zn2+ transport system ATPase subunit
MQDGEQVPIESLSGGEFDRLSLALFLCFNKTSKSDIILLDECLASLHSELVEDIINKCQWIIKPILILFFFSFS